MNTCPKHLCDSHPGFITSSNIYQAPPSCKILEHGAEQDKDFALIEFIFSWRTQYKQINRNIRSDNNKCYEET